MFEAWVAEACKITTAPSWAHAVGAGEGAVLEGKCWPDSGVAVANTKISSCKLILILINKNYRIKLKFL